MGKKPPASVNLIRDRLRQAVEESGMTQEEIGLRMGFSKSSARQAVSRLLNPGVSHDPRLSTLLELAKAINRDLNEFL